MFRYFYSFIYHRQFRHSDAIFIKYGGIKTFKINEKTITEEKKVN